MDFLAEKKNEIQARLDELQPLVAEYERLEKAANALGELGSNGSAAAAPAATTTRRSRSTASGNRRRGSGSAAAKPAAKSASSTTGRRGRPPGSGKRAQEALELITSRPGITIPEIAEAMGIKQNYLYRVIPGLAAEGKVRKEDRGWFPA
jgi:hypothetical protein